MISVVIPARNAAAFLPTQLRALAAQTFRGAWEVVVADNGSTDATRSRVRELAGTDFSPRLVDASGGGINRARNAGAAVARGDFILFVDADDMVAPTWLDAMAQAASSCAAVGGRLERSMVHRAIDVPSNLERTDDGLRVWPGFLPYPSGSNCGVRASVLWQLGGFDERYRGGGDDAEFFWRVQLAGHAVCFVPDAVVYYRERETLRQLFRQHYRYGVEDPHLYRDFRDAGMPAPRASTVARGWAHLLILGPWYWLRHAARRQWVRSISRRMGRLVGSLRNRTAYL